MKARAGTVAALLFFLAAILAVWMAADAAAAPTIFVSSPPASPYRVASSPIELRATVVPANGSVELNGTPVALDGGGNLSISVSLVEGPNNFTLTALDWQNASTSVTVQVVLDTVAPALNI